MASNSAWFMAPACHGPASVARRGRFWSSGVMLMDAEDHLRAALSLPRPPVAVSFLEAAPDGVRRFMGQVPSSCSFWSVAASAERGRSAFVTLPADHHGCPIGSYTHNVEGLDWTGLHEMLAMM